MAGTSGAERGRRRRRRRRARVEAAAARPRRVQPPTSTAQPTGRCSARRPAAAGSRAGCRAHQHVVDAGQHRAVERRRVRHLHLLQVVHPDRPSWPSFASHTSTKLASTASCCPGRPIVCRATGSVRRARVRPPGTEILLQRLRVCHAGNGEALQCPANVAADVAVLQPPSEDGVEGGAGHHAELTAHATARRAATGYAHPHAALNDQRASWSRSRSRSRRVPSDQLTLP